MEELKLELGLLLIKPTAVVIMTLQHTILWAQLTVRLSCWSSMFNVMRPKPTDKWLIQHTFK